MNFREHLTFLSRQVKQSFLLQNAKKNKKEDLQSLKQSGDLLFYKFRHKK